MAHIDISDRTYSELLMALMGLYLLVYGNGKRVQHSRLFKTGIRVPGKVSEIKKQHWSWAGLSYHRGQPTYYPVIHFNTIDSGPVSGDYDIFSSNPSAYAVGEKVEVLYDPNNHKNFIVDNFSTKIAVHLLMIVGVLIVFAAIVYYIFNDDSYIRF